MAITHDQQCRKINTVMDCISLEEWFLIVFFGIHGVDGLFMNYEGFTRGEYIANMGLQ